MSKLGKQPLPKVYKLLGLGLNMKNSYSFKGGQKVQILATFFTSIDRLFIALVLNLN